MAAHLNADGICIPSIRMFLLINTSSAYSPNDSVMAASLIDGPIPINGVVGASSIGCQFIVLAIHSKIMDCNVLMRVAPFWDIFTGNLIDNFISHRLPPYKKKGEHHTLPQIRY
jgi:hypothetical protein